MNVGLFIPCYIDQFYPQVAIATLKLLEKAGCDVDYPLQQTCCGQPMANSGYAHLTGGCNDNFVRNFAHCDYIVSPSGSCTLHIKHHLHATDETTATAIRSRIYELTEFLTDVLNIKTLEATFPYRVGLHQSCHGQRGLGLAQMSELMAPPFSKPVQLLSMVQGLELVQLDRRDECCGFGGTFCVTEEAVSAKMGKDRVADHPASWGTLHYGCRCVLPDAHGGHSQTGQHSTVQVRHIAEILTATL